MLKNYQRKRDFNRTDEPAGTDKASAPVRDGQFVVQKHRASQLHYDFRLAFDGVLKSWAVPKGPSDVPGDKRLAIHVEDHPLDYGGFEGVIPKEEYGGGTVMLWDRGDYQPDGDIHRGYERGEIKVTLHGEKMRGRWALVRTGKKPSAQSRNWLLIKDRDEWARQQDGFALTREHSASVVSRRNLNQIAGADDENREMSASAQRKRFQPALPSNATPSPLPEQIRPQLATLVHQPPEGDDWLHEIKLDGYRLLIRIAPELGGVTLVSRRGHDWTARFEPLAHAARRLPVSEGWIDGEVVVLRSDGTTSFQALQNVLRDRKQHSVVFFAFDLLHLNGYDLTAAPLRRRKELLKNLLAQQTQGDSPLRFSDHMTGQGVAFYREACRYDLEGIVSKQVDSAYIQKRSSTWLKAKCQRRGDFVIVGWTDPSGSRRGFGSLLLAYRDPEGAWVYAGRVGTGFDERTLSDLRDKLDGLAAATAPLKAVPRREQRAAHWVRPQLVAEIRFSGWTNDQQLRQPAFLGLREDKNAGEVIAAAQPANDHHTTSPHQPGRPPEANHQPASAATRAAVHHSASASTSRCGAKSSKVAGVALSHPERVLYPDQGLTKADLADYYERIADWMLPHLINRPLAVVRCPRGRSMHCFFQKHLNDSLPETIHGVQVRERDTTAQHMYVDGLAGLISLVQLGALEIHPWQCCIDQLDRPDRLVFDLDPGEGVRWPEVIQAARRLRELLADEDLPSFVKTTGGKGLHVEVPLQPRHDFDQAKAFTRAVAGTMARQAPDRYVATMNRGKRKGKVFIDYFRNGHGATAVAAYSTRARPGAPVATPLRWDELRHDRPADYYRVVNLPRRLASLKADPWRQYDQSRQPISKATLRRFGLKA